MFSKPVQEKGSRRAGGSAARHGAHFEPVRPRLPLAGTLGFAGGRSKVESKGILAHLRLFCPPYGNRPTKTDPSVT